MGTADDERELRSGGSGAEPASHHAPFASVERTAPSTDPEDLQRQVQVLAQLVDRNAESRRTALEAARAQQQELERQGQELVQCRNAYSRLARRRAVRLATGLADRARRLIPLGRAGLGRAAPAGDPAVAARRRVETGTVGRDDPTPGLLGDDRPADYRAGFLGRLVQTPGPGGLRIVEAAGFGAGERALPADPGARGWPDVVVLDDPGLDIRRLARHVVTVARVGSDAARWLDEPWFEQLDIVIADDDATAGVVRERSAKVARVDPSARLEAPDGPAVREALGAWARARRFAILVQSPTWQGSLTSGDYHFARGMQRQLERRGHPTSVYLLRQWPMPATSREDVVIHLWGRYPHEVRPGQVNALWILYHPELVTAELLERYDRVFVASDTLARALAATTRVPVEALHQATDPERMSPGSTAPHHELLFVGNSRGTRRTILDDLGPTPRDLAVFGGGWDPWLLDPAHRRGEYIPYAELAAYYRAADIVLNDHWREAADAGLITNRLYDTLAAGGFAMSDPVQGIDEEFDGGVATYRSPSDLALKVEHYLADPAARAEVAARGRAAVLARHTFEARVSRLIEVLLPLVEAREG